MTALEELVKQHQVLMELNDIRIKALEDQMVKLDKLTAFLSDNLIDCAKKVNEALMIANQYERKQIKMVRTLENFLDGIGGADEGN